MTNAQAVDTVSGYRRGVESLAVERETLGVEHETLGIRFQTQGIEHETLGIGDKSTEIEHESLEIEYETPGLGQAQTAGLVKIRGNRAKSPYFNTLEEKA